MTHPINGIDDLIYVVIFGAHAYAVQRARRAPPGLRRRRLQRLQRRPPRLQPRRPDDLARRLRRRLPRARRRRSPTRSGCTSASRTSRSSPTRASRCRRTGCASAAASRARTSASCSGRRTTTRRSSTTSRSSLGASDQPLTGGYQLLRELEIGPLLASATPTPIGDDEWELSPPAAATIACDDARVLQVRARAWRRASRPRMRAAPRTMGAPAVRDGSMTLQEGIYHAPGRRPGRFFALLFLRVGTRRGRRRGRGALGELWAMYQGSRPAGCATSRASRCRPTRTARRPARLRAQRVRARRRRARPARTGSPTSTSSAPRTRRRRAAAARLGPELRARRAREHGDRGVLRAGHRRDEARRRPRRRRDVEGARRHGRAGASS